MKSLWLILKETGQSWMGHDAPSMGAALAYYSVLSMAPLVVIAMVIAGSVFGDAAVQGQIVYEMRTTVGSAGAEVIQAVLQNAHRPGAGSMAAVSGLLILLVGASGVFIQLQNSLNRIWEVPKKSTHSPFRIYVLSFVLVVSIGCLLLVILIASAAIEIVEHWLSAKAPALPVYAEIFTNLLDYAVIAFLFALIYKFVPAAPIDWGDVWVGALTTAGLFTLGKFGLALYIARMSVGNSYGAAGSLIALLVWVYYSAQIFLFGAEFTHVCALRRRR